MAKSSTYSARPVILVGLALIALICLPLYYRLPTPVGNWAIKELNEAGHTLLYFMLQLGVIWSSISLMPDQFNKPSRRLLLLFITSAALLALGASVELIQPFFQRNASWMDMGRNAMGVLSGGFFYWGWQANLDSGKKLRWWSFGLAALFFLAGFASVGYWTYAHIKRNQTFPVLQDFDGKVSAHYIAPRYGAKMQISRIPDQAPNNNMAGEFTFPSYRRWAKVSFNAPVPDWTGYDFLEFDVYSSEQELRTLGVKVFAAIQNAPLLRNQSFEIVPGHNFIRIPLTEIPAIARNKISEIVLYAPQNTQGLHFWLDNLRLAQCSTCNRPDNTASLKIKSSDF